MVRCDLAQRTISLTLPGASAPGATLAITTTDGARTYPATDAGAVTRATDPFLDRIAFSRGRFRVQLTGRAALILPAWPEFARTVEDCRS